MALGEVGQLGPVMDVPNCAAFAVAGEEGVWIGEARTQIQRPTAHRMRAAPRCRGSTIVPDVAAHVAARGWVAPLPRAGEWRWCDRGDMNHGVVRCLCSENRA